MLMQTKVDLLIANLLNRCETFKERKLYLEQITAKCFTLLARVLNSKHLREYPSMFLTRCSFDSLNAEVEGVLF